LVSLIPLALISPNRQLHRISSADCSLVLEKRLPR